MTLGHPALQNLYRPNATAYTPQDHSSSCTVKLSIQFLGALLVAQALSACMDSSGNNGDAPVINQPPPDEPWQGGYYYAKVSLKF